MTSIIIKSEYLIKYKLNKNLRNSGNYATDVKNISEEEEDLALLITWQQLRKLKNTYPTLSPKTRKIFMGCPRVICLDGFSWNHFFAFLQQMRAILCISTAAENPKHANYLDWRQL